jgi:hypothetical protein
VLVIMSFMAAIDDFSLTTLETCGTGQFKVRHTACEYRHTYTSQVVAPEVFKSLRSFFGMSSREYQEALSEKLQVMNQSGGRSGSYFFKSSNGKFIMKVIAFLSRVSRANSTRFRADCFSV